MFGRQSYKAVIMYTAEWSTILFLNAVDQMSFGQMVFDQKTFNRSKWLHKMQEEKSGVAMLKLFNFNFSSDFIQFRSL
jgi:hypothetical protein